MPDANSAPRDVSAWLVHWNAPEWCFESVASLRASSGVNVKVSVVNNHGELDLPADVEVVDPGINLGFAGGANVGLAFCADMRCEYVFIGCHDVRLEPSAMLELVRALDGDDGLGIVGPVLNGAGTTERDLLWISGSGMLIRRDVMQVLRFDERYGSYVEDVDFCHRARRLGWRVGRAGAAHAATAGSVDKARALVLMHGNSVVFFVRTRQWREAAKRVALLAVSAIGSGTRRDLGESSLYLRALAVGLTRLMTFPFQRPDRHSRHILHFSHSTNHVHTTKMLVHRCARRGRTG